MPVAISLRAYAKHRGCSVQAVSRAIAGGRLVASVTRVAGVPKIASLEAADAEWVANTDHSRAPDYVKERGLDPSGPRVATLTAEDVGAPAPRGRRTAAATSLTDATMRERNARADLAELEYQTKAGGLVPAAEVEAQWHDAVTQMRTAMMGVPSKLKGACPDASRELLATLNDLLQQALESIAIAAEQAEREEPAERIAEWAQA